MGTRPGGRDGAATVGSAVGGADAAIDVGVIEGWVAALEAAVTAAEGQLTELDAAIGDADHGTNMTRGLRAATSALSTERPTTPAAACRAVGLALTRAIGGASGPLYGTVFVAMSEALPDAASVGPHDLAAALREGLRAVQQLGAAVVGDKTMIDAIAPAVADLEQRLAESQPLPRALASAAAAAEAGAAGTVPMRARKGRASYLGARSEGHQDPGATSSAMLFATLRTAVGG